MLQRWQELRQDDGFSRMLRSEMLCHGREGLLLEGQELLLRQGREGNRAQLLRRQQPMRSCATAANARKLASLLRQSKSPGSCDRGILLCAEHVRQLGGASPLHNVMDVK